MAKLTEAQRAGLERLLHDGFVEHVTILRKCQANKPYWRLVELGLAEFKFGPEASFLKTQGFMPTSAGRAALESSNG